MFRIVGRYLREQVQKKVIRKKDKPENTLSRNRRCNRACDRSFFPDYFKRINKRFRNYKRIIVNLKEDRQYDGKGDAFSTASLLRNQWIETLGWSGTLAFGWAFSHNLHILRRSRNVPDLSNVKEFSNLTFRKHLCPHLILRNILVSNVLAQPNEIVPVNPLIENQVVNSETSEELPVFGPKTAEETLEEATNGLKEAHNETIGELENRLGLRCMFKHRYRQAIIHFAAGSALHNSSATFNLAQCYELGLGTDQDFKKAGKFYRTASDQGNASATYNLAVFYAHGYGGLKSDRNKALELLKKAYQLGEPAARRLLQKNNVNMESSLEKVELDNEKLTRENCKKNLIEKEAEESMLRNIKVPFTKETAFMVTNLFRKKSISTSTDDGVATGNESLSYSNESYTASSCKCKSDGSLSDKKNFERLFSTRCNYVNKSGNNSSAISIDKSIYTRSMEGGT